MTKEERYDLSENVIQPIIIAVFALIIFILMIVCKTYHNATTKDVWISYKCTLYYPNGVKKNVEFMQPDDQPEPHIESTFFGGSLYINNIWTSNLPNEIYGITDMRINKKTSFVFKDKK